MREDIREYAKKRVTLESIREKEKFIELQTDSLLQAGFKTKSLLGLLGRRERRKSRALIQSIQCFATVHEQCIGGKSLFIVNIH